MIQNNGIYITTDVVIEATHGVVLAVRSEDFHYLDNSPIQLRSVVSAFIFTHHALML